MVPYSGLRSLSVGISTTKETEDYDEGQELSASYLADLVRQGA